MNDFRDLGGKIIVCEMTMGAMGIAARGLR